MDKIINFFTTTDGAWGDGSVKLTSIGVVLVAVCILALVVIPSITGKKNSENKTKLTTKQLTYSAVALALAMVCSMIKFANLPMGGSCTLCSMLFIVLIGYWYGPYVGLTVGFAYGLLQFIMEPIFYTLPQMLIDYPLAFGALGLAGFFAGKKHGLQIGYIVGVIGRYIFSIISGVVFFSAYAPEGTPAIIYSLGYNATYLIPEAIVTLIIISIPAVAKALDTVKKNALS
ncbi:MAG: energy-coupled thiamine transporter ThiT [Roseburia sp.]|nr:energy-coupled thiamine transporter ThiT [Roseburia sp.]